MLFLDCRGLKSGGSSRQVFIVLLSVNCALFAVIAEYNLCCWYFDSQLLGGLGDSETLFLSQLDEFHSFLNGGWLTTYEILEYFFFDSNLVILPQDN